MLKYPNVVETNTQNVGEFVYFVFLPEALLL